MSRSSKKVERFSSSWGLLAASLGCAIGLGNIWRFPRLAAENGGGAFIIVWFIFLFIWSIPLLIAEYSIGRRARAGLIGSFVKFGGSGKAWMGGFMAVVATAVLFYYTVIAGWCFHYFGKLATGGLQEVAAGSTDYFLSFTASPQEYLYMLLPLIICGGMILFKGVAGIESMNKVMIPVLFIMLILAAGYALSLDGAWGGVAYLFTPKWEYLLKQKTWIDALGQSAWSTGAGFGLYLTYAVYVEDKEDIVKNSILTGVGNSMASIIAALAVVPAVFALNPTSAEEILHSGSSVGLTFFALPKLFATMPFGNLFGSLFFLTLIFAALSSLISLLKLPVQLLTDFGFTRQRAVLLVCFAATLIGGLSAYSLDFLDNQDFVWGTGLIISGFMLNLLIVSYGVDEFRQQINEADNGINVGIWFNVAIKYLIPVEFVLLMLWWWYGSMQESGNWWNPLLIKSVGTCLLQWGVVAGLLLAFNKKLANMVKQ